MSTPNNFHQEDPLIDALDAADSIPVFDASTGRTSRMTAAMSQAATLVAGSTSATITSNGLTTISSAANGKALLIAAPVVGQRKILAWLNSTSTATTITASTDASITFDGTNCILTGGGKPQVTMELIGLSATRYAIVTPSTGQTAAFLSTS